jgi:succinylarginine dihydrolase
MPHRSHEWPATSAQLGWRSPAGLRRPRPVPPAFGDEGAANHMRLALAWRAGVECSSMAFGRPLPARQHVEASKAIARLHRLDPARTMFAAQSDEAIAAGAFHNDVVAVANGPVLFAHEKAFADRDALVEACAKVRRLRAGRSARCRSAAGRCVKSYLFNAQLVTPPDGAMTLVAPTECRDTPSVNGWIERHLASNGAIRRVNFVDVRQSMANGGGPACLRLRVACDPADVDPRFLSTRRSSTDLPRWSPGSGGRDFVGRNPAGLAGCRCGARPPGAN